ncbi:vinorine synthase-like isoform X2 [Cucurbita moschata]|uniref:Vinorine synthase-like isoform X2 n=1 Tax=Cucurbita moschata TaxID=3662 RepID=A0A6J1F5C1_CUCMO|nr:vinorine synthase-like isoform X2 [Cucurbita moschata]
MELEIVSKETIKPLSSTPPDLTTLTLSWFDQHTPNVYTPLLYFYTNNNAVVSSSGCRGRLLKDSLSKALTFYYPFAGRLRDGGNFIDCNDMGATFVEAKLRCPMSEVMNTFDLNHDEILKLLCFEDIKGKVQTFDPLLSVQLTQFECGGEVMYVSLAHKVADLATFANFMNDWASIARSSGGIDPPVVCPLFHAASLFRPELDGGVDPSEGEGSGSKKREENVRSRRMVFEGSKIRALKAMVSKKVENPTRVQVLTAFIYKAIVSAKNALSGGLSREPTSILQFINLRSRVEPPLPGTLTGNIVSFFRASSTSAEQQREMELWSVVGDMKRNFEEFCRKLPRNYRDEEGSPALKSWIKESFETWMMDNDGRKYGCSSWCRFPLYEADFGWGTPIWIAVPAFLSKNTIGLMDAKDGEGIEAIVCLDKDEMAVFETNEELLSFCHLKT